jgi:hypothetical protein
MLWLFIHGGGDNRLGVQRPEHLLEFEARLASWVADVLHRIHENG